MTISVKLLSPLGTPAKAFNIGDDYPCTDATEGARLCKAGFADEESAPAEVKSALAELRKKDGEDANAAKAADEEAAKKAAADKAARAKAKADADAKAAADAEKAKKAQPPKKDAI